MNAMGRRIEGGANSVRKIATPSESGTAITSAISEDSSVPKISGSAPNLPATGSHSLVVTNWSPKVEMARREPCQSSKTRNISSVGIASAARVRTVRKIRSPVAAPWSRATTVGGACGL